MSDRRLDRLELMLADLERVAGINPTQVVMHVPYLDSGEYGEPDHERFLREYGCTLDEMRERVEARGDHLTVVELVGFSGLSCGDGMTREITVAQQRNEAALTAEIEAFTRVNESPLAIHTRRDK